MIIIVRTCVLYDNKNTTFKGIMAVNSCKTHSTRSRKFFGSTFNECDISLKDGVFLFSKRCLKEYYYLTNNTSDNTIKFIIQYTNNKLLKMFYHKSNMWFDQLESLLEADGIKVKFEKMERKKCLKI